MVLAAVSDAEVIGDEWCCYMYTGLDYSGDSSRICMPNNIWGDQLISYGFSFHHTDEYNSIQDSLQSYKCGSMVGADFCYVEVARKWDAVEQS